MSLIRLFILCVCFFAALNKCAAAAVTHTTSDLNLRPGAGTTFTPYAVIPAGAAIDVMSCEATGVMCIGMAIWDTSMGTTCSPTLRPSCFL